MSPSTASRHATLVCLGLFCLSLVMSCGESRPRRNALLITLDTTRRGALGVYGSKGGVTPNIDALAREGLVYDQARTVAPITLPAHSSMMTGLYPLRHGVHDNGIGALPASAETLAERAQAAGYQTAACVAAVVLAAPYGLSQGFDHYDQVLEDEDDDVYMAERKADQVLEAARSWLNTRDKERPFFLWVHLFDPHAPYDPPPKYLSQARGAKYRGEVAYADWAVGQLLDELKSAGVWEDTLVILTADHGEDLGQHGEPTHGAFCYDTVIAVPLIVRDPGGERAGQRSDEIVSVVDVYPTIIAALDLGEPGLVDGQSLYRRQVSARRGVYFESYYGWFNYGWSHISGWADSQGKYMHGERPEYYRTQDDPGEKNNLYGTSGVDTAVYVTALERLAQRPVLEPDAQSLTADATMAEMLRGMGYASAGDASRSVPGPLELEGRPVPHEHLAELGTLMAATTRGNIGEREPAIEALRELLVDNPRNLTAQYYLARFLQLDKQFVASAKAYEQLLTLGAPRLEYLKSLALCYLSTARAGDAEVPLLAALDMSPRDQDVMMELVRLYARLGREDAAARMRERLRATPPD